MTDWIKCKLGDILTLQRGHDLSYKEMKNGHIPVVGSNGIIGYHDIPTTKKPCVTIGRSGNIGHAYYYDCDCWAHNTVLYVKDFKNTYPKYAYYLLKSMDFSQYNVGSAVPTLNRNHIHPIEILYPPLPVQKKIAAILSSLDDKIEINTRMNKVLEETARALFHRWFVEFEFPNDEGKPYKSSGGRMIASEMGEIPEGWGVKPVSDLLIINPKLKLPTGKIASFVDMASLPLDSCSVSEFSLRESKGSGSKFQNGDVLFARITPCLENGKTAIVDFLKEDEVGFGSTEFIVFRGKNNLQTPFVYCLSRDPTFRQHCIASMVGSSGRQRVQTACFDDYQFVQPAQQVLAMFDDITIPLFQKIRKQSMESQRLVQVRELLLPKLMNGKVKVI